MFFLNSGSADNKSILANSANSDWKRLWLETGQLAAGGGSGSGGSETTSRTASAVAGNGGIGVVSAGIGSPRTDNHLDSSDSALLDDGEVSEKIYILYKIFYKFLAKLVSLAKL